MNPELWHAHPALAFLSWLPVPLGTLALWLPAWPPFARRFGRPWAGWVFFALTRVVLTVVVFGVLGHRSTDWFVNQFQGESVLAGGMPYRDFETLFAPGLPFLFAAALRLSQAWGPIACYICADLGAFAALARLSGGPAPSPQSPAWAYLAFTPVWYFESRYAQEESLAALFLALALLAFSRRRQAWAGAALAIGQLFTKILFGLCALPLLVARGTRGSARLAYFVPVAAVYLGMTVAGWPWAAAVSHQAGAFGSGPTLWRLPALWWNLELGRFAMAPFALALTVGWWRLIRAGAGRVELAAWLWGCYALLAPKLLPMYVVMVAPALALWVARGSPARFRWWGLYAFAFATAWYADSGLVQGGFGRWGVALGAMLLLLPPALDAWLLVALWRGADEDAMRTVRAE